VQFHASRQGFWTPKSRVVAAVSGGSDSVALTFILDALAQRGYLQLAGLAHLHHHIRGHAADEDCTFVEALAERLFLPCRVEHADIPAQARQAGQSLEVAGRNARLDFYRRAVVHFGAESVALAHTRGDQAETVLLRLTRGAGPRGLGGMAPRSGDRIRPLLELSRQELREWLEALGEPWREDATNNDLAVARNRIRHQVIPHLALVNPRVEDALSRAARIQSADADLLEALAAEQAGRCLTVAPQGAKVDLDRLRQLPEALSRRVVLRALTTVDPLHTYGWDDSDVVLSLADATRRHVKRVQVELNAGFVVLTLKETIPSTADNAEVADSVELDVPGSGCDPSGRWIVDAEGPMPPKSAGAPAAPRAVLDAAALGRHLTIRGWRPGDRVQPLGLGGRKKLQDVFVDRKVPRDERALVPVVLDARERVAWVAGHVVGEPFRVTPHSVSVVVLTLRR